LNPSQSRAEIREHLFLILTGPYARPVCKPLNICRRPPAFFEPKGL
jgi:hypothetical protein